ncbi:hypothetical protein IJM86_05280 [bacterium]|nr:hypothetical protein [bacterium]
MGYFICKNEQKEVIPCNDLRSDIEEKFIANLQKADFKNIEKSEQYPRYLNKLGTFTLEKEEYLQEEDSED